MAKKKLSERTLAVLERARIDRERLRSLAEKAQVELDRRKAEQQRESA